MTEPLVFEFLGRDTTEKTLVLGDEVLIGQTVVGRLDLLSMTLVSNWSPLIRKGRFPR